MKTLLQVKKELEQLIARNNTKKALNELLINLDQPENNDLREEIIVLSARFEKMEKDRRLGVRTDEDYNISLNKINQSLLSVIQRLPENELNTDLKKSEENDPSPIKQELPLKNEKQKERYISIVFGISFLLILLILAIFFPHPTSFQYTVFRIVLALAVAGAATMLTGFLEIKLNSFLRAGGTIAIFVMVYFFSPANLVVVPGIAPGQVGNVTTIKFNAATPNDARRPFAIRGKFAGDAIISTESILLKFADSSISFPVAAPDGGGRYLDYLRVYLVRDNGTGTSWVNVAQSVRHPIELEFPVGSETKLPDFELEISRAGVENLSTCWLVFDIVNKLTKEASEIGSTPVHSSFDIFGGM